jgi:hypothetical protein
LPTLCDGIHNLTGEALIGLGLELGPRIIGRPAPAIAVQLAAGIDRCGFDAGTVNL